MEDIEWEDVAIGKSQRAVEGYTGNIDLASRPIYINDDGSISTEVSTTLEINGKHVILPTIRTENGQRVDMTPREAGDWYIKTGEHLGIFDDADEAEIMAQKIHTRFEPETDDIEWEDAKPVTQSVMDDRDGQVYNVPLAYDGVDTRFAIDTQHKGADKGSFFGKVFMDVSKMTTALTTSNMLSKMLPDNISFEGAKDLARGLVGSVEGFVDNKLVEATDLRQKQRIAAGKTYQMSAGDPLRDMAFDWEMPTEEEQEEAKKLVETAQKIRDANKEWWNNTKEAIKPEETMDEADKFIEALGGGIGSMGFSIGSMLAFKNPTVGSAIIASEYGKMAGNHFFDEAVKNGMDFDMAYTLALGRGGIEGGIELVADTTLAKIANLKAMQDISNRVISSGLIKAAQSKLGKSAMQKIGTRHANSVFGAAIKGFGSEAGTEGLQQSLGMFYDNAAGIADYSLDQILGETLFASVIGGITGGLGAGGGTLAYNRQVVDTNERIKKVLQEQTPDLTAEETQTMADALQEMLYQESTGYMNELNNVMEKELAPDARQEGLTPEQLTAETRKLLKEKYQMNDVDIDKTIKSALSVIDARNQFNEAYAIFNEGLSNAGRDAARADGEARILAARALAVARAESVQVKDVLDRWNLQFRQTAWNEGDIDGGAKNVAVKNVGYADFRNFIDEESNPVTEEVFDKIKDAISTYGNNISYQELMDKVGKELDADMNAASMSNSDFMEVFDYIAEPNQQALLQHPDPEKYYVLPDDIKNQRLNILTFDNENIKTKEDVEAEIQRLIDKNTTEETQDGKTISFVNAVYKKGNPSKRYKVASHIAYSSKKKQPEIRNNAVFNINDLIKNSVFVEEDTQKQDKRGYDKALRFYTAVRAGNEIYPVRIVALHKADTDSFDLSGNVYDVIFEEKEQGATASLPNKLTIDAGPLPDTISISDLLQSVKSSDGRTYYQGGVNENIYKATNSNEEPIANPANFNKFIEGSRVTENDEPVSPTNPPKKIYRGDTRYFEEYEEQENAFEYDWGRAFYLSDNYDDILTNYQSGGADLKNRIDREAEQLADEEDIDYDEAREKVRQKYEQEDIVREFYLSIKEPVIIGGDKETFFDYTEEYDEETDEYGEPQGKGFELIGAIENYLYDIGADDYVQTIVGTLQQEMMDNGGLTASQVEDTIRGIEEVNYLIDYESGAGELLSSAFGAIGFDGIIDHRAGTKFRNMNMDADTTHYIVFNSEQAKSVDNKGEWGVRNRNFYYQFAGPNAQTAALDQLKKAKQLEKNGIKNEAIRQQTGWFKGIDGKWRFEISDKDADFANGYNPDEWKKNGVVFNGLTFKLGKILKHDNLFAAYPQLKDVVVEYTRRLSDGALGNFTPSENKIYIDSTMSADKIKDVLLHEIQHAIQVTEGFAMGGSEESAVEALRSRIMRTENSSDMGEFLSWVDEYELLNDVSTIIRLSENPESLTKTYWFYERFLGTPKNKKDRQQFLNEKGQEFLDFMREKYQGWGEKTYRYREYLQKDKAEIDKMRKSASQKVDRLHKKVYSKGYLKAKDLITKFQDNEISAFTLYKRLYGEIEARNTQARANMSDEERRATPIEETQDIKNADAIVMFSDGTAIAYKSANQEQKQAPRGAYRNSIIYLFENADASTVIHELGHFFLDDMQKFADNETTKAQLEAIYKYVGSADGNLTVEQHEYFANSFELYLLEGRAPNKTLEKVFWNFRKWISRIWSEIKRLSGINLTPEIRKVFDEMLGGRGLDFAMQMSGARMAEALESGTIPPNVIAKAIELLETGKMSRADMDDLIARMKNGDLKRKDFNQELKKFENSNVKHGERLNPFDKVKYKEALARGNFSKKDVLEKINRLLKWTEPRSQNGKVVGRFSDLKMNQEFDHIRELMNMEKAQAKEKLDENIKLINAMIRGEETGDMDRLVFDNKILTIRLNKANASLLLDVYNAISDSYNMGRLTTAVTGEARRARKNRLINEAVHVLTADGDVDWRRERGKLEQFINQLGTSQMSWQGILDILSMNDKTSKTGQSLLVQNLDVFDAQQKEAEGLAEDGEKASRFMEKKLKGVGNAAISVSRYVNSKLDEKFTIQWGLNKKTFTKDQLLDIYMKSKDDETRKMMAEDPILQYNERFLSEVNEILTAEDRAIAEALFEFYDDNYAKINAFYEEKYGTSLGKRAFYSPRSMDRGGVNVDTGDLSSYAGFSGVKERKAKAGAVKIKGAFQVLQDYIVNSNHWIAWSDKLIDINAVMGDVEVKNIIRNLFGEGMEKRIGYEVSRMASNDKFQSKFGYGKLFNKIRSNYAIAALAAKPSLMIKQLTSFPAYWEHMSTAEFMSGLADFAVHMKEAVETLGNTTLMKTRDVNIIKDFEELSKSELFKKNANKVKLRELLMANIKLGDRGAIYMGGWALYKAELKKNLAKGMSEEKAKALALEKFERVTDETQQSGRLSQQSYWQSNPFLRAFTMFQSSQNQYLRKEINAIRGLATGRMDKKQALKTLFIFHVLLPCFFQYASDGFDWDEKAQLRAALLGSLNGIFILNGILERGLDYALGTADAWKATSTALSDVLPFWGSGEDLAKFFIDLAEGDIDLEDYVEVIRAFGKPLGELTGIPVKYPLDVIQNFGSYAEEGEVKKEVLLWLGWSPYALRDKEED